MIHQWFAIICGLPLVILALTGTIWAIGKYYLGMTKDQIKWLIWLHQGWIELLWPYFPPILAFFTLFLVFSGVNLIFLEMEKFATKNK